MTFDDRMIQERECMAARAKRSENLARWSDAARKFDAAGSLILRSPVAVIGGVLAYAGFAAIFGIGASTKVICSAYWDTCVGGSQPGAVSLLIDLFAFALGLKLVSWALKPLKRMLTK